MKSLIAILLFLLPLLVFAAQHKAGLPGIGNVAQNMMEPVSVMADLIDTACFVLGGSFVLASVVKYFEHKRSPLMVPISTVVFLFIVGIVLIGLPFVALVTEHGVPYSLMKK